GNGGTAGHRSRLARPHWGFVLPIHQNDLNVRHFSEIDNRVSAPLEIHNPPPIKMHGFFQDSTDRLNDVAMNLMTHTRWIDDHAGILPNHDRINPDTSRLLMNRKINNPTRP